MLKIIPSNANFNSNLPLHSIVGFVSDFNALRFGVGIFETMLLKDGKIRLFPYHWQRLTESLTQLQIPKPEILTETWLQQESTLLAFQNNCWNSSRIRLQVFPIGEGYYGSEFLETAYLLECFPLPEKTLDIETEGLTLGIATGLAKTIDSTSNLKTNSALIYALAARQAQENNWDDAILQNCSGNLIETTIANLFWVKNYQVHTTPLKEGCVAGVMRRFLVEHLKVIQTTLTPEILAQADEVFLTNSINGIRWVQQIGNNTYTKKVIHDIYEILNAEF